MQPPADNGDRAPAAATAPGSIELRIIIDGECDCGVPKSIGAPHNGHRHRVECDWGRIDNTAADPRYSIGHLMLTTASYVRRLLRSGPELGWRGISSASVDGERLFMHLDQDGRRWTWEVFEAHFADAKEPDDIMVGRWPD